MDSGESSNPPLDQTLSMPAKMKRRTFSRLFHRSPKKVREAPPVATQVSGNGEKSSSSILSVRNNIPEKTSPHQNPDVAANTTAGTNTAAGIRPTSGQQSINSITRAVSISTPSTGSPIVKSQAPTQTPAGNTQAIPVTRNIAPSIPIIPKKTESPWELALAKLSLEDKQLLSLGITEKLDILKAVLTATEEKRDICRQKQWRYTWKGETIILRDIADKIIVWVNKFKSIGDVVISFDQKNAALPWGAFRFILQIATNDNQNMGAVLVALEIIANLMGRCAIYETLYTGSGTESSIQFENEIVKLYAHMLLFLARAKQYYLKNTGVRILFSIFETELASLLDNVTTQEASLLKVAALAEAEYNRVTSQKNQETTRKISDELKILAKEFKMPIIRVESNVRELLDFLNDEERAKILMWLSHVEYEKHHANACIGRVAGTGEWLLRKKEFIQWQKSSASTILWLRGIPGAGKTKLTSRVIDSARISGSGEALAYFYCKRDASGSTDPEVIMNALVKQLCRLPPLSSIQKEVVTIYEARKKSGFASGSLGFSESLDLIITLINIYPQTTIIIDALDECDPDKRKRFFKSLRTIVESSTGLVKIFVSSRNDDDIVLGLKEVPNFWIETTDNEGDIERFIQQEVKRCRDDGDLLRGRITDGLMEKIVTSLVARSGGMFMWADLQIKHICAMDTPADIEVGLNTLPETLEKTYLDIYDRIQSQKGNSPQLARITLMWVLCSAEELSPEDLTTLVSLSAGGNHNLSVETLFKICHNLLVINRESNVVQVAHLSVREFLEEKGVGIVNAHTMASKFCLSYMMDPDNHPAIDEISKWDTSYVAHYAVQHWMEHTQHSLPQQPNNDLSKLLTKFLKDSVTLDLWRRKHVALCSHASLPEHCHHPWGGVRHLPTLPIRVALCFGFREISGLWESEDCNIWLEERQLWVDTLVYIARETGHDWVLELLLDKGVDINGQASDPERLEGYTALAAAAYSRNIKIVELLLEKGADVNVHGSGFDGALRAAASGGNENIVKLLLDRGADVNACDGGALRAAVLGKNEDIVKLLLDRDADVNACGGGVLAAAAYRGDENIVKLLLDRGVDVNAYDDGALRAAVLGKNEDIVKLLLDRGADVNAYDGGALTTATYRGDENIAKLLLNRGADVNACYGGALRSAAIGGNEDIVKLLLDRGADVNACDGGALQAAAIGGNENIVKLLLDRGADVNTCGGMLGSALQIAVRHGKRNIVKLLLDKGGDIDNKELLARRVSR